MTDETDLADMQVMPQASLPAYVQISELLIRDIAAGRLADGARLPPERQMAAGLGISVGTLRKALADIESKGLLSRVQGSGNYVRHGPMAGSIYAFFRLERLHGGGLPTAQVLSVTRLPKPESAPDFGRSAEAHCIRRLRRLDGVVVALEEIWLDGGQVDVLRAADLSESLYLYYRKMLGLEIARIEDRIGTAGVPVWAVPEFAPLAGQITGFIERVSWTAAGAPVEYSRTWFDSDKARYISRLGKGI